MTKWKTIGAIAALLLGSSTLAIAQERVLGLPVTPPAGGSHPEMVAPQNAPDSWALQWDDRSMSAPPAAAPRPQMVDMSWLAQKQIEAAGYDSVHGITPSLDGYTARAMESGQSVVVDVDGNGNVRRVANQH